MTHSSSGLFLLGSDLRSFGLNGDILYLSRDINYMLSFWKKLGWKFFNQGLAAALEMPSMHGLYIALVIQIPVAGWHNMWGYRGSQQILKSYRWRVIIHFRNKNAVIARFHEKMMFFFMTKYHDMSWFFMVCHDMSWHVWQKCTFSVLSIAFLFYWLPIFSILFYW